MKKILFGYAVLIAFTFSSCKNDEIDVEVSHILSMSVSTSSPINAFGSDYAENFKSKYLASDYSVFVASYIYDQQGNAVDSVKKTTNTFDVIDMPKCTLLEGTYKIATIEFLVHSGNGLSPYWNIVNSESLSTLAVVQKDIAEIKRKENIEFVSENGIIGVSTNDITIGGNNANLSISPQVLGSLIDIRYLNFNFANYKIVSLCTKDAPNGYYLDPKLNHSEHYTYTTGYAGENIWRDRSLFKIDEVQSGDFVLDGSEISQIAYIIDSNTVYWMFFTCLTDVKKDGEYQSEETVSSAGINTYDTYAFEDGKYYYVAVAYTGKFNQELSSSPISTSFADIQSWYGKLDLTWLNLLAPYNVFGASIDDVKAYMKDYDLKLEFDSSVDSSHYVIYKGYGSILEYTYIFESGKLENYALDIDRQKISEDDLISYLDKKYNRTSHGDGYYYFKSDDGLQISVHVYSDIFYVSYKLLS